MLRVIDEALCCQEAIPGSVVDAWLQAWSVEFVVVKVVLLRKFEACFIKARFCHCKEG